MSFCLLLHDITPNTGLIALNRYRHHAIVVWWPKIQNSNFLYINTDIVMGNKVFLFLLQYFFTCTKASFIPYPKGMIHDCDSMFATGYKMCKKEKIKDKISCWKKVSTRSCQVGRCKRCWRVLKRELNCFLLPLSQHFIFIFVTAPWNWSGQWQIPPTFFSIKTYVQFSSKMLPYTFYFSFILFYICSKYHVCRWINWMK